MSRKKAAGLTRNEILDAAWILISQKGAEVSMSEIAASANVSRQSVYLHFKTRGGLLMALVKRADERFRIKEDFFAAMKESSPRKRLDSCLQVWFEFALNIQPVATELIRLRKTDADAEAAWNDRMAVLRSWERLLIKSLDDNGVLAKGWSINDATDFLWASSSIQAWNLFIDDRGWPSHKVSKTLRKTISDTLLKK